MANRLADYISERLSGFSQQEIADKTGIAQASVSRILKGSQPSIESCIRLAWPIRAHPAILFEMAGFASLAFMLRDLFPIEPGAKRHEYDASYSALAADLHRRLQSLVQRGLAARVTQSFDEVERSWEHLEPVFTNLAAQTRASAAVLLMDSSKVQGDVLFRWECPEPMAAELASKRAAQGWIAHQFKDADQTFTVFLKRPSKDWDDAQLDFGMNMLAAGIRELQKG